MLKRSILSPMHVITDLCDGNAAVRWIPVTQPYPSGHQAPLFHPNCRCIQEVASPTEPDPSNPEVILPF
jgi:hypothetical protein